MTTTTTTTTSPASPAALATGAAGTPATPAVPAAGALFTALLASMGGSAQLEGAAPAVAAEGEAADLGVAEEDAAALAAATAAPADPLPVVPAIVLVPAPAEPALAPALAPGTAAEAAGEESAIATAAAAAGLAETLDPVVGVPVAPAVLLAVADAMPEQATPLPAEAPVRVEAPATGTTPVPAAAAADDGPAMLQVPVQTTAPAAVTPPPVAASPPAEPAVRPLEGRRSERASETADVPASAVTTGQAQPAAAPAAVAVLGGETVTGTDAHAGASTVDRERFERLVDGLAARLRVSLAGDGARVRMHLTPRELGEVVVRLELKDGLAHAHLIADTREASRMLTAAIGDLRTALADRGVQLDTMDVRVSGDAGGPMHGQAHAEHGRQPQGGERRGRMPLTLDPLGALTAAETPATPAEAMAAAGVSVLA
jgi:flagellar hook-length control protein FliK